MFAHYYDFPNKKILGILPHPPNITRVKASRHDWPQYVQRCRRPHEHQPTRGEWCHRPSWYGGAVPCSRMTPVVLDFQIQRFHVVDLLNTNMMVFMAPEVYLNRRVRHCSFASGWFALIFGCLCPGHEDICNFLQWWFWTICCINYYWKHHAGVPWALECDARAAETGKASCRHRWRRQWCIEAAPGGGRTVRPMADSWLRDFLGRVVHLSSTVSRQMLQCTTKNVLPHWICNVECGVLVHLKEHQA